MASRITIYTLIRPSCSTQSSSRPEASERGLPQKPSEQNPLLNLTHSLSLSQHLKVNSLISSDGRPATESRARSHTPHPNQVRSACERCRRQKLRCARRAEAAASCVRCSRLGLTCQSGPQRKVGRPTKKDGARKRTSAPALDLNRVRGDTLEDGLDSGANVQFLDGLLEDQPTGLDWVLAGDNGLGLNDFGHSIAPMDSWPVSQDPKQFYPDQTLALALTDHLFESLSRINVEIHRGWEVILHYASDKRFEDFIRSETEGFNGYVNLKTLIKSTQEYLVVIKALHRKLGTRPMPKPVASSNALTMGFDPVLSASYGLSTLGGDQDETLRGLILDSPTVFLVVSCYVQLVKHSEFVFKMILERLRDTQAGPSPAAHLAFADVAIIESSTQFIVFTDLMYHILAQINVVLGLPSPWYGRSTWTGLLRPRKYREMLNKELGAVEGLWTVRPARLLEITRVVKDLLMEQSMTGYC